MIHNFRFICPMLQHTLQITELHHNYPEPSKIMSANAVGLLHYFNFYNGFSFEDEIDDKEFTFVDNSVVTGKLKSISEIQINQKLMGRHIVILKDHKLFEVQAIFSNFEGKYYFSRHLGATLGSNEYRKKFETDFGNLSYCQPE